MARKRTVYVCSDCGSSQPKWEGRCPDCKAWNTLREMVVDGGPAAAWSAARAESSGVTGGQPVALSQVATEPTARTALGIGELDRVLGGGLVPGAVVLIAGEPGIGKSTLTLRAAENLAQRGGPVLYVSGEESAEQIKLRAHRMGLTGEHLHVLPEAQLDAVFRHAEDLDPAALVVDSIQTARLDAHDSAAGSVTQVRECTAALLTWAKGRRTPAILVGHVTKSGEIAGPRTMEHMVDVVLQLEGDRYHSYRLLRSMKNRFGSTNEIGVFEMRSDGLVEVPDPSAAFLAERLSGAPGSAVTVTMEGTRPLLVEVQALVGPEGSEVPRRTANGIDFHRLLLLTAVLGSRLGIRLGNRDVFTNVVGGLRIAEPAVDLPVALAVASSASGIPLPNDLVAVGEVGLSGELRSVSHIERRLQEAAKLGFRRALVPATALGEETVMAGGLETLGARALAQAIVVAGLGGRIDA